MLNNLIKTNYLLSYTYNVLMLLGILYHIKFYLEYKEYKKITNVISIKNLRLMTYIQINH